ncbi:unnamed protein product, partial [Scytosiphon promiscuus]
ELGDGGVRAEGLVPGRWRRRRRRPLDPSGTSLAFRVFREEGWARGGGKVFSIRVVEEDEGGSGTRSDGARRRRLDPPARKPAAAEPHKDEATAPPSHPSSSEEMARNRRSGGNTDDSALDGSDDGEADGRDGGVGALGARSTCSGGGVFHDADSPGAAAGGSKHAFEEGGGGGGDDDDDDPLRFLCLTPGAASVVRRRLAGVEGAFSVSGDGSGGAAAGGTAGHRHSAGETDRGHPAGPLGLGVGGGDGGGDYDGSGDDGDGSNGGGGGLIPDRASSCRASARRDGVERVSLTLEVGGTKHERDPRRPQHLLAGLTPHAVRLVKERIFSVARVEYALLYGLGETEISAAA